MKVRIVAEFFATVPDELVEDESFDAIEQDLRDLLYVGTEYTETPIDFIEFDEMYIHVIQQIDENSPEYLQAKIYMENEDFPGEEQ